MHGAKDATTDAERISKWWDMWPNSNVGIATGSGLQVLDVESHALNELDELIAGREWPRTPTVYTGGGGLHFYFAGTGRNSVSKLGPGIDVRGEGGFVVAPPSRHVSGQSYCWLVSDAELAPWPSWLVPPEKEPVGTTERLWGNGPKVGSRAKSYVRAALEQELEALRHASEGTRNDQLNRSTFALARFVKVGSLKASETADQLLAAALACGLPQPEAEATIRSGMRSR
jgi:Bifunctional DNA primase/polymerase, N-terminal